MANQAWPSILLQVLLLKVHLTVSPRMCPGLLSDESRLAILLQVLLLDEATSALNNQSESVCMAPV